MNKKNLNRLVSYFLLLMLVVALFPVFQVNAAAWINFSSPSSEVLRRVKFASASGYGWIVGENGTTLRYLAGQPWISKPAVSSTIEDLLAVDAIDNSVWIVGTGGLTWRSTDAGTSWITSTLSGVVFYDVDFVTSGTSGVGWRVGASLALGTGVVYKSTNGGSSWTSQTSNLPAGTPSLQAISCVSTSICFVAGASGSLIKTTNGGSSWATMSSPGTTETFNDIHFVSSGRGWVVGNNGKLWESDGSSWFNPVTGGGSPTSAHLLGVDFIDTNNGWIVGDDGALMKTTDGASAWTSVSAGTTSPIRGVDMLDASLGWAVGGGTGFIRAYDGVPPSTPTAFTRTTPANDNTPTLTWGASGDNTGFMLGYLINVDGAGDVLLGAAATSYTVPSALADGNHIVTLRARDSQLNDSSTVSLSFSIDTTAPTVDAPSPGTATAGTAQTYTVTYSDSGGVSSCNFLINGVSVGAMTLTAPGGTSGSATRSHTLTSSAGASAQCTDAAGNVGTSPSVTVTVTSAPSNTAPSSPSGLAERDFDIGPNQSVGFTDDDSSVALVGTVSDPDAGQTVKIQFEVRPVGTAFTNTATAESSLVTSGSVVSWTISGLSNGSYHWQARAVDSAGATSSWVSFGGNAETSADFTISATAADTTPPDTTITSGPALSATVTSATFSFTATETATFGCAIDGGAYVLCASPNTYSGLAVGSHTVLVRATDATGNTDSTPASYTWTITAAPDATPPTAPTGLAKTTPDSDNTPTFSWTASTDNVGVSAYEVQIDGGAFTNIGVTTSYTTGALGDGAHSFGVRAKDAALNASSVSSIAFTILAAAAAPAADVIPPTAPTGLTKTTPDSDTTPTFSWTASTDNIGVTAYHAQIDSSAFIGLGNATTYQAPELSAGTHTIGVRATDATGNLSPVTQLIFNIGPAAPPSADATPPTPPANLLWISGASDNTPTFKWQPSTDNVGVTAYEVQFDGAIYVNVGNITEYTAPALADGSHAIRVRALDAALNASPAVSLNFSITTGAAATPPASGALSLPSGVNYGDLVKLPNDGDPNTYADTSVFYIGANGKRYVFPHEKVYFSWYSDFSGIKIISPAALAAIPLGGNVTYRPGAKMIKLQTSPDVYVVFRNGHLRKVPGEAVAAALYGVDWNRKIDDVSDAFWFSYTVDAPLVSSAEYSPLGELFATQTISADKGF